MLWRYHVQPLKLERRRYFYLRPLPVLCQLLHLCIGLYLQALACFAASQIQPLRAGPGDCAPYP